MRMEGPNKRIESEFKFYEHEFKAEMEKFMKEGDSEEVARQKVLAKEEIAKAKQSMANKEKERTTRYLMPDEPAA